MFFMPQTNCGHALWIPSLFPSTVANQEFFYELRDVTFESGIFKLQSVMFKLQSGIRNFNRGFENLIGIGHRQLSV